MIHVCNRFRPINKESGNFLLFSQYAKDLSRSTVDSAYQVKPSRFLCMYLDQQCIINAKTLVDDSSDYQESFAEWFQNYFENAVAVAQNPLPSGQPIDINWEQGTSVTGFNFSAALFDRLNQVSQDSNGAMKLQDRIKYVGDIDLVSWQDGFADIILNINSGSTGHKVQINSNLSQYSENWLLADGVDQFTYDLGKWDYTNQEISGEYYISGWGPNDIINNPYTEASLVTPIVKQDASITFGESGLISSSNGSVFNQLFQWEENPNPLTNSYFMFNSALIMYDIIDGSGNILQKDIPMGLYLTGDIVNVDDTLDISNPVIIYKSSTDSYGAGSGWSLRICTRFSPTPHGDLKVEEVALESGALSQSLSALMAASAEVIKTVQTFADESIYNSQTIKDMYSIFKNGRTNVPYIREVNGVQYWFVNGRNTGVAVNVIEVNNH